MEEPIGSNKDQGIELLVDTVKEGRMDPWDLDIIEVTDRYLEKIDTMDHRNLTVSGRLFFYASVLLRLKAEYTAKGFLQLSRSFREEDEGPEAELEGFETDIDPLLGEDAPPVEAGEQLHLPGMLMVPRPAPERKRGLSLQDLIAALQRCEDMERRRERARKVAARQADLRREVVETAHGDDLGGDIVRMRNKVGSWPEEQDYRVPFEELICEHLSPTTAYMALLFLASNSEVRLHQERFYRDLYVSRAEESPEGGLDDENGQGGRETLLRQTARQGAGDSATVATVARAGDERPAAPRPDDGAAVDERAAVVGPLDGGEALSGELNATVEAAAGQEVKVPVDAEAGA